jgi:hypothetical protein
MLGPALLTLPSLLFATSLAAVPAAPAPSPSAPPLVDQAAAARPPAVGYQLVDNLAVPALQLLGAEALVVGSAALIDHANNGVAVAALVAAPLAVPLSTCGIGALSRYHDGRCWHAFVGTAAGVASGLVVLATLSAFPSLNPVSRGSDDTQAFTNQMTSLVYTAFIGVPVGTVVAWNLGKHERPAPAAPDDAAGAAAELPAPPVAPLPRALALSGSPAPSLFVPVLSGTF